MHTTTLFSDRAMRTTTFALIFSVAVLATGIASAFFATTLTANALATLPRVEPAPLMHVASNADFNSTIAR